MLLTEIIISEVDKAVNLIKKDCQPFLELGDGLPLFRGAEPTSQALIIKKEIRMDRKPRDSRKDVFFNWSFNSIVEKQFQIKNIRNSCIFCSHDVSMAANYGVVHLLFPIGKFDYFWSPVSKDSFDSVDFMGEYLGEEEKWISSWLSNTVKPYFRKLIQEGDFDFKKFEEAPDEELRKVAPRFIRYFDKFKFELNTNFKKAMQSNNEIFIIGPGQYYMINLNTYYKFAPKMPYNTQAIVKSFMDKLKS